MKKMFRLCIIVLCSLWANLIFAQKTVTLATTTWKPYVQSDQRYHGYAYQIVKAAFNQAGYKVNIKFMSWQSAMNSAKMGKVTGVFPAYYSPDRKADFGYSKSFSGSPLVLFTRKNLPHQFSKHSPEQIFNLIGNKRIASVEGYRSVVAFDNNKKLNKVFYQSDFSVLKQLYRGKVDYALIDQYVAEYLLHQALPARYAQALVVVKPTLAYKKLFLAIPKNHPHYRKILRDFNKGLKEIRRNGVLSHLLAQDARVLGTELV